MEDCFIWMQKLLFDQLPLLPPPPRNSSQSLRRLQDRSRSQQTVDAKTCWRLWRMRRARRFAPTTTMTNTASLLHRGMALGQNCWLEHCRDRCATKLNRPSNNKVSDAISQWSYLALVQPTQQHGDTGVQHHGLAQGGSTMATSWLNELGNKIDRVSY